MQNADDTLAETAQFITTTSLSNKCQ